ncbi:MAG: hypothetical protein JAY62_17760 [Candidatus Thiodiazotropha endolucinida]|nr:hypothetical protein [Candidatus Thiodiazotropha taylori]MCW4276968.1 hypothetical protein [Candidatus Thiodiazotropha taylori]
MRLTTTSAYLNRLFADSGIVELRHIEDSRITSGLYDNLESLLRDARSLDTHGNLFTTLNAPKLIRVRNRLCSRALRDADIAYITRLPIDFDPVRPPGTSSTEEELQACLQAREHFVRSMSKRGWPIPLLGKSGNGYHVQFRCRLPVTSESRQALKAIYLGLAKEFSTDQVLFDRTVRNPSRIFTLYGSTKRKGVSTPERPHRRSTVWIPESWESVSQTQIMNLAEQYAGDAKYVSNKSYCSEYRHIGPGDYNTLDIVSMFKSKSLYKRPADGSGKHYVTCPWAEDHSTNDRPDGTDTVIWEADGNWPTFHCSHDHCIGRDIRNVIEKLGDPDKYCSELWSDRAVESLWNAADEENM